MAGKGDHRRPSTLSQQEWEERWLKAFGKAARSFQESLKRTEPTWTPPENYRGPKPLPFVARAACQLDTPTKDAK